MEALTELLTLMDPGEIIILIMLLLRWYRDASKDRQITQDEWHELANVIVDRVLQHRNDVGEEDENPG
jgi:hypothetical protein